MNKRMILILAALFAAFAVCSQRALAQSGEKKIEVGGQFTLLRVPTLTVTPAGIFCVTVPCPTLLFSEGAETDPGFGGRIGYNVTPNVTLEAEGSFFPRDRDLSGGQKTQGLFGVKAGKRFDKAGIFGKVRPGFVRFSKGDYELKPGVGCPAVFPPPIGCFQPVARTSFALDLGGVGEFYPSKNTILRFDVGDTIIRFGTRSIAAATQNPLSVVLVPVAAETKHNFQASVGVGFRF